MENFVYPVKNDFRQISDFTQNDSILDIWKGSECA